MLARFALLKGTNKLKIFFDEFFTPTERLMLAKRLALIVMLDRGYSFIQIQKILKLSPTTVARFWRMKKEGAFGSIVSAGGTSQRSSTIFARELLALLESMSVYSTKRQWQNINRVLRERY